MRVFLELLGWPKSLFRLFCTIGWKPRMNFLASLIFLAGGCYRVPKIQSTCLSPCPMGMPQTVGETEPTYSCFSPTPLGVPSLPPWLAQLCPPSHQMLRFLKAQQ